MKFVALLSGGKDSIFAVQTLLSQGHQLVAIAHLQPPTPGLQIDSFMYQSVASNLITQVAQAVQAPLFIGTIQGKHSPSLEYHPSQDDQVEDLFRLLQEVAAKVPDLQGVSSGAILSTYQKNRVENVASRLGLISLAPLWNKEQGSLLSDMIKQGIDAIIVKTACYKLSQKHLLQSIKDLQPYFHRLQEEFGMNECGEGGEYETLVVGCPLYNGKRIHILGHEVRGSDFGMEGQVSYVLVTASELRDAE